MSFNALYQTEQNGPLTKELRDRISAFRPHFTLKEIGDALGFSGPWVSQILNEKTPARVDSKHIPRVLKALADAEEEHASLLGVKRAVKPDGLVPSQAKQGLDYHLAAIDALGWQITGLARK